MKAAACPAFNRWVFADALAAAEIVPVPPRLGHGTAGHFLILGKGIMDAFTETEGSMLGHAITMKR
jgi:hypothetical protein